MTTIDIEATSSRIRRVTETRTPTDSARFRLAEAFAFRLEQLVLGEAASETQKPRVRDHAMRRAHAPPPHRPSALEHLEHLEHPEPAHLPQTIQEPLHLADVRGMR